MSENSIKNIVDVTMEKLRASVDADTVVGKPVTVGEMTLIPVSKIAFGMASGGSDFATKENGISFGGGAGAGVSVTPVAFIAVCAVMAPATNATSTLWALLPPVIAICLALITKEVYSSLFAGILVGGLLYSKFNLETTMNHVFIDGFIGSISDSYNAGILAFAKYLEEKGIDLWIRHVVVPGISDDPEDLRELGRFIGTLKNLKALDVLPYHTMGVNKYKELGMEYPLEGVEALPKEKAVEARKYIIEGVREVRGVK